MKWTEHLKNWHYCVGKIILTQRAYRQRKMSGNYSATSHCMDQLAVILIRLVTSVFISIKLDGKTFSRIKNLRNTCK